MTGYWGWTGSVKSAKDSWHYTTRDRKWYRQKERLILLGRDMISEWWYISFYGVKTYLKFLGRLTPSAPKIFPELKFYFPIREFLSSRFIFLRIHVRQFNNDRKSDAWLLNCLKNNITKVPDWPQTFPDRRMNRMFWEAWKYHLCQSKSVKRESLTPKV